MRKPKKKTAATKCKQSSDDFVSVARCLGADEDKGRFEAMLRQIARASKERTKQENQ
jgi:hypothetical protein